MHKTKKGPSHSLNLVKQLAKAQLSNPKGSAVTFDPRVLPSASRDFNWGVVEILNAITKLNCRDYILDAQRNHYHKTEPHRDYRGTKAMMDYYKARKINGFDIYTHFAVVDGVLEISSFHKLD